MSTILTVLLPVFFGLSLAVTHAQIQSSTNPEVILSVKGCNNNGICEAGLGEDYLICPLDCSAPATTTPPTIPPPTGHGGNGQLLPALYITSINLEQHQTSVKVTWETSNTTISSIFWGALPDYEIGSIGGTVYTKKHSVTIDDLSPNTRYYLRIDAKDLYGQVMQYSASFLTLPLSTDQAPANPTSVTVAPTHDGLLITWVNPSSPGFDGVVVVRSPYNFPHDPADGKVIYQGRGSYTTDPEGVSDKKYFYTIFSYDAQGRFSSGVVFTNQLASTTPDVGTQFAFDNLLFIQDGKPLKIVDTSVTALNSSDLVVLLPIEKINVRVRNAFLSVETPTGVNRYLMRYVEQDGAYETKINAYQYPVMRYPISVLIQSINDTYYKTSGNLYIANSEVIRVGYGHYPVMVFYGLLLLILFLGLLALFTWIIRRIARLIAWFRRSKS